MALEKALDVAGVGDGRPRHVGRRRRSSGTIPSGTFTEFYCWWLLSHRRPIESHPTKQLFTGFTEFRSIGRRKSTNCCFSGVFFWVFFWGVDFDQLDWLRTPSEVKNPINLNETRSNQIRLKITTANMAKPSSKPKTWLKTSQMKSKSIFFYVKSIRSLLKHGKTQLNYVKLSNTK